MENVRVGERIAATSALTFDEVFLDAIHATCAITHGIYTIISEDTDFDKIAVLSREWMW